MLSLFLFLSLREAKNASSLLRFFLYGDDFKPPLFSATLIAANAGLSGSCLLIMYYGYLYGLAVFPFVWLFWILTQIASAITVNRVESLTQSRAGNSWFGSSGTLHEFIGASFGCNDVKATCALLSCCSYVGLIACELVVASHILNMLFQNEPHIPFTHLPLRPFIFIAAVTLAIAVYNVRAGFRGVVQTDFVQWIIISLMVAVLCAVVLSQFDLIVSKYPANFSSTEDGIIQLVFNPDRQGVWGYVSFLISNIIFWGLWWPTAMDQWQRCAATKERSSSLSSFWGTVGVVPTLYFGVLSFAFVGIGTLIHITAPKSSLSPDLVRVAAGEVVAFGNTLYGPFIAAVLCAILIWGLICAAMSTIDTYIMSASHSIFPDFLARNRGTLAEQSHSDGDLAALQTARRVTGVVPLIVICMAIIFGIASDVYAFVYFSFSFMFAILPPLIVSLCGVAHRYPPRTAVVSLAVGALFAIVGYSLALIPALEFGLRSNRPELVFWSYQGIYWWPILTALVGGSVFLVRGKSLPEDKPSLIHF
ncbi:MAG: hypothetical protein ACK5Y6_00645 [Pseudomonadota bacterium]